VVPSSIKWVFCKQNIERHQAEAFEAFKSKYPDEKIEVKECAGADLCSLCRDVPFCVRNGAIVHAGTERDLYWKLDSGMEFTRGKMLVDIPLAPPAPPKEAAAKPAAAAAKPAAASAQKAEEAPKAAAAPKAEEAPKAAVAPKAEEAPKVAAAPKGDEPPKLDSSEE
jgi:uncharacterized protein YuzB (UPF0349 family)